jgi:ABC-type branched-subunit amino acid transport system substrate-binding protein
MEQATVPLGFKYIADTPTAPLVTNWAPIVQSLKDKGVQYLTAITTVDQTVQMLKAMKVAGFAPKVVDLAQQYYDPALASSGVAEGAYVLTNTQPFEEPNAAIDLYNQWLEKAGGGTAPTTLGVESFSAGLLFAKVAGSLGSHLTRENLITGLTKVTSWDAGGLHPSQNPGQNVANSCVLYLQVKGGKFVRAFPDKGFACNKANTAHVSGNFGKVPVEK